jgi:Regulator of chromosome condensation (RCC1) repeat
MKQSFVLVLLAILLAVFVAPGRTSAAITPLARITMISTGEGGFGLALRDDGAVLGWGANAAGMLGNGTTDPNLLPSPVVGLGAGSDAHRKSCATSSGTLSIDPGAGRSCCQRGHQNWKRSGAR